MWHIGRFSPQTPRGIHTRAHKDSHAYPKDPIKTTPLPLRIQDS
jgi:hypothetical protein